MKSNDIKILDNGWMEVPFSYMAENISKRVDPKDTDLDIYIGLEHIDPGSLKIKRYGKPEDVKGTKLIAQPGDIIFGKRRAYQGKVGVCEWDAIVSAHSMVLRPKEENIERDFLKFFMQSEEFYNRSIQISEGSLSPTIKWKVLEKQRFIIPTIQIQKQLISQLITLDNVLYNKNILLKNTKIYRSKLIEEILKKNKLKLLDLETKRLSDIGNFINGRAFKPEEWKQEGLPIIRIANLNSLEAEFDYFDGKIDNKNLIKDGDLLLSWSASLGVYKWNRGKAVLNQHIFKVDVNELVTKDFAFYLLEQSVADLCKKAHGTTMKHIKKKELDTLKVSIPSIENQVKISKILSSVDETITKLDKEIDILGNMRKELLNKEL